MSDKSLSGVIEYSASGKEEGRELKPKLAASIAKGNCFNLMIG